MKTGVIIYKRKVGEGEDPVQRVPARKDAQVLAVSSYGKDTVLVHVVFDPKKKPVWRKMLMLDAGSAMPAELPLTYVGTAAVEENIHHAFDAGEEEQEGEDAS